MNKVILIGNLSKTRTLKHNKRISVCKFDIAVQRQFETNGEREADFSRSWRGEGLR